MILTIPFETIPVYVHGMKVCSEKRKIAYTSEDQFIFQDRAITQVLVNQLRKERNLKVITLSPMEPNLPRFVLSVISKESINDINNNLADFTKSRKEQG